ncbi:MAG: EAL domain-containing response regulator [Gammaproteobacteria bacterium]|nr:EAL domain-containing response regulator [Gammaproteobacteria bacterium]MDH3464531.1 EAL domain-containing response regulator [Gammaproteobacteria bacterium]
MTYTTPKLLIIEDETSVAELVSLVAESTGFDVTVACGFQEIDRAFDDTIQLVVLDMMMPEMDGIEVIRYLAANNCRAAFILFSSVDEQLLQTAMTLARAQGLWVWRALPKTMDASVLEQVFLKARAAIDQQMVPEIDLSLDSKYIVSTAELEHGLANSEFLVLFQPKIGVSSRQLESVEALVRWQHPEHGLLGPNAFIHTAEEAGLAAPLTTEVMNQAFSHASAWAQLGLSLHVAVNVPALLLGDVSLPDRIAKCALDHGIKSSQIIVEITESWLASNAVTALDILTRLRLKGFELSIDDYGTGYSTLLQLKDMPFSELKLDQSFVRGAGENKQARTIAGSSVTLGQNLDLKVVAEGVETVKEWRFVQDLGCDIAQGFFIAAPMRGEEIPEWHVQWQHRRQGLVAPGD